MTDNELAEFIAKQQAIEDERTHGKWHYNESRGEFQDENTDPVIGIGEGYDEDDDLVLYVEVANPETDFAFIENVTEHYGTLLAELERLRIENVELAKAIRMYETSLDGLA